MSNKITLDSNKATNQLNLTQGNKDLMYQLNKKQTASLVEYGKVTFLYKSPAISILITVYRDQIHNGIARIPVTSKNNNFRLLVTIPYYNQLKDTVRNN